MRVGNELGAGNPKSAAFSVLVVNLVSFVIAVIEAMVVLSLRHVISYAFTSGEKVSDAVSELCPFLAVTLILNGVQPVLSGNAFLLDFKNELRKQLLLRKIRTLITCNLS